MCDFSYDCLFKLFKSYVSSFQTHTHKCRCFVSNLCFSLFCLFLFWRELRHPIASHFYGTVIRKHNLFVFCFLKIYWFSLWHKTCSLWGTIPCTGKAYILSRSRLRNGRHWISTAIFSLQNYTLFLQHIWFILLSMDKFFNT